MCCKYDAKFVTAEQRCVNGSSTAAMSRLSQRIGAGDALVHVGRTSYGASIKTCSGFTVEK